MFRVILGGVVSVIFFAAAAFAAADAPIGTVISLSGDVKVIRGKITSPIVLKDALLVSDTVSTGEDGRVKILLRDDTAITLSEQTDLDLAEFEDIGESPEFSARLVKGTLRIITGKITETNPEGFKINTPHATVGIRGTIFTLSTNNINTILQVLNSDKGVVFNGVNVYENFKAVAENGAAPQIAPLTQSEKENSIREMVLNPETGRDSEGGIGEEFLDGGSVIETLPADNADVIDIAPIIPITPIIPPDQIANFSGNIAGSNPFSFELNLQSGAISNAATHGGYDHLDGSRFEWDINGGAGELCANGDFEITGFSGFASRDTPALNTLDTANTWIAGNYDSAGSAITDGIFQLAVEDPLSSNAAQIQLPAEGGK